MTTASEAPDANADHARATARLAWARAAIGGASIDLVRASADAGFRSYWRAETADGSRIVMDSPPALEDVRPWLHMRDLLEGGGVRVPRVLAREVDAGFLLLEDLGRQTCLQALVGHGDADALERTVDAALDQLLRLQSIAVPAGHPCYDRALLERELGLFDAWFLGRHLGVTLDDAERRDLSQVKDVLIDAALAQSQVLVHRDFMLRNLMPDRDDAQGVVVLDFQDAVRGPIGYDVLSLCKDAFASWPPERIAVWQARYHARATAAGLPVPDDIARFRRDVDLIGVQRHLKVLGIFARLHHRDGKPQYLADAPRFLRYLDDVLDGFPELASLHALLQRHVHARIPASPNDCLDG